VKPVIHHGMQHPLLNGAVGSSRAGSAPGGHAGGTGDGLFAAVLTRAVRAAQAAAGIDGERSPVGMRRQPLPAPEEDSTVGADGTAGAAAWTSTALAEARAADGREPVTSVGEQGRGAVALSGGAVSSGGGAAEPVAAGAAGNGPRRRSG